MHNSMYLISLTKSFVKHFSEMKESSAFGGTKLFVICSCYEPSPFSSSSRQAELI